MTDQPSLLDANLKPPAGVPADIVTLFEKLALDVAGRGFRRYSSRAVFHRLRWHHQIEKGQREFALNNLWSAGLARWFMNRHPELPAFFETRDRRQDGGGDE